MGGLLRAEALRVRTTRGARRLLAAAAVIVVAASVLLWLIGDPAVHPLTDAELRRVLGVAGLAGGGFAAIMGALVVIGRRREAATVAALIAPTRWPAIVAKFLVAGGLGLLSGIVAVLATTAVASVVLALRDSDFDPVAPIAISVAWASVVACCLAAITGAGLAAMGRNRWSVVLVTLVAVVVAHVTNVLGQAEPFFPVGAVLELVRHDAASSNPTLLSVGVVAAYAVLTAIAGAGVFKERDIR